MSKKNLINGPLLSKALPWLGAKLITGLFRSCRVEVFGKEIALDLEKTRKDLIYSCWHRGDLFSAYYLSSLGNGISTLVSHSKDGDIIAGILSRLGITAVRGSSTRGGHEALEKLVDLVKAGHPCGLSPDGPIGPQYVSKMGIIMLAARTGSPLIPCTWEAYPSYELNSWDRFIIPKPFSRIALLYDREIICVPDGLSKDSYEQIRQKLDSRMNTLHYQARYYVRNNLRGIDPRDISVPDDFMDYLPKGKPRVSKNRPG
jgi:lysophospholipid acyltransferase (LPLAT)-like uncharacterized protein